jgi:hypothetical protein
VSYFFLYPAGHLGLTAVTFLVSLPLTQEIVIFFEGCTTVAIVAELLGVGVVEIDGEGDAEVVGLGDGLAAGEFLSALIKILGEEKWKPLA